MNIKNILFLLLFFAISQSSFAQRDNRFKVGLTGFVCSQINLKYERVLTPRASLQMTVGYRPNLGLTLFNKILDGTNVDNKLSGIVLNPEFRWYFKKDTDTPKGWYTGVFVDYYRYTLNATSEYDNFDDELRLRLRSASIGVMLGAQWYLSDRVSIDWYITGLGVSSNLISARYSTNDPGFDVDQTIEDINETLQDTAPWLADLIVDQISDLTFSASVPFGFVRFRTGLSLGYSF